MRGNNEMAVRLSALDVVRQLPLDYADALRVLAEARFLYEAYVLRGRTPTAAPPPRAVEP
jgi:hypothetical protein